MSRCAKQKKRTNRNRRKRNKKARSGSGSARGDRITYRLLRQICIEADVPGRDVHIALQENALEYPAGILLDDGFRVVELEALHQFQRQSTGTYTSYVLHRVFSGHTLQLETRPCCHLGPSREHSAHDGWQATLGSRDLDG